MMRIVCALLVVALSIPIAAADAPSDARREAATQLLHTINLERTMAGGAAAMADAMIQQNPMLGPYRDVLLKWAGNFMTWKVLGSRIVDLYAESFTEGELRDMNAFYKTPTGQKALAMLPELSRRGALIGAEVAKEHSAELEQMVRERAAELTKMSEGK